MHTFSKAKTNRTHFFRVKNGLNNIPYIPIIDRMQTFSKADLLRKQIAILQAKLKAEESKLQPTYIGKKKPIAKLTGLKRKVIKEPKLTNVANEPERYVNPLTGNLVLRATYKKSTT